MANENSVSYGFLPTFVNSINVFNSRLSGVRFRPFASGRHANSTCTYMCVGKKTIDLDQPPLSRSTLFALIAISSIIQNPVKCNQLDDLKINWHIQRVRRGICWA